MEDYIITVKKYDGLVELEYLKGKIEEELSTATDNDRISHLKQAKYLAEIKLAGDDRIELGIDDLYSGNCDPIEGVTDREPYVVVGPDPEIEAVREETERLIAKYGDSSSDQETHETEERLEELMNL